ncbi:hypothetical protein FGE12_17215 [Aggregicoccus sp. 17bor-14]|nr:hypothetical protein [Simulacricoccus sp. 17bor-14]MRI89892.1 hypothetical protein [Aggregicoccus sp. 17bor-14]
MVERGPTRADPALEAWCSFCCRPHTEVGALVAGPAGAFICAGCTGESSGMLGGPAPAPGTGRALERSAPTLQLVGQEGAQALLERALAGPPSCTLLLGPEGSGKSVWVSALVADGRAVRGEPAQRTLPPLGRALVLEDVDRLPAEEQGALASWLGSLSAHSVLLSARADAPKPLLTLYEEGLALPVFAAPALAEATALDPRLLAAVGPVVCLARPDAALLAQVARAQLSARPEVQVPDEALEALARAAGGSGHVLSSLLSRLCAGTWTLEAARPPSAKRPKKGKA